MYKKPVLISLQSTTYFKSVARAGMGMCKITYVD